MHQDALAASEEDRDKTGLINPVETNTWNLASYFSLLPSTAPCVPLKGLDDEVNS